MKASDSGIGESHVEAVGIIPSKGIKHRSFCISLVRKISIFFP
jgi:hypothetical protein